MTARVTIKRALEKAGFVHLRSGWVRKEAAPRLQDKIDRAVADAADGVDAIRNPPTEYERKVAQMKEDFPNGI